MRRMAFLAVVLFAATALAEDNRPTMAINRCVIVETQTAKATGVIVYSDLVLTNYHVIEDNTPVTVNGKSALVTMRSKRLDLALLLTDTPAFPWIEFCDAQVGDEVYYVGHPMAHVTTFVVPGVIVGIEDFGPSGFSIKKCVYSNAQGLPGFSGSGLYCKKHDKLVGLEFGSNGLPSHGYLFSVAVPAKEIKKFLGLK